VISTRARSRLGDSRWRARNEILRRAPARTVEPFGPGELRGLVDGARRFIDLITGRLAVSGDARARPTPRILLVGKKTSNARSGGFGEGMRVFRRGCAAQRTCCLRPSAAVGSSAAFAGSASSTSRPRGHRPDGAGGTTRTTTALRHGASRDSTTRPARGRRRTGRKKRAAPPLDEARSRDQTASPRARKVSPPHFRDGGLESSAGAPAVFRRRGKRLRHRLRSRRVELFAPGARRTRSKDFPPCARGLRRSSSSLGR